MVWVPLDRHVPADILEACLQSPDALPRLVGHVIARLGNAQRVLVLSPPLPDCDNVLPFETYMGLHLDCVPVSIHA